MLEKQTKDAFESGTVWHGRRKGVVEFVDRTHFSAVNQNKEHLHTCLRNPRAYATKTGGMTNPNPNPKPQALNPSPKPKP